MKFSLTFIIRDDRINQKGLCPIYLRYTYDRKWKNLPLKYSIEPQFWDKENSSVSKKYSNHNHLKKRMYEFEISVRNKIDEFFLEYKIYPSISDLEKLIQQSPKKKNENSLNQSHPSLKSLYDDFVIYKTKNYVKQSTLNIYKYTWDKWILFENSSSPKSLMDMNEKTLSEFVVFLLNLNLQKNSIGKYIKTIKTFLRYVSQKLEMNVPVSFQRVKVDREDKTDFQVFTKEEFENLKREVFFSRYYKINKFQLTEREILIGRIMIFLCSTGLSFVDFDRLTINDIYVERDNLETDKIYLNIKIHRQKLNTTEVCIIPIIDLTIDLLIEMVGLPHTFYGSQNDENLELEFKIKIFSTLLKKMKKGEIFTKHQPRIFPKVYVQDFNKEIKLLLCKIGMIQKVKIRKQVKNNIEEKVIEKFNLITSHTGRRTYITSCLQQGISPHILMKTTGHKKVGTLLKYNQETDLNIFREFENKIKTKKSSKM